MTENIENIENIENTENIENIENKYTYDNYNKEDICKYFIGLLLIMKNKKKIGL